MIIVHQPEETELNKIHGGINFYIDELFKDFSEKIIVDFENEYFIIHGIEGFDHSCRC